MKEISAQKARENADRRTKPYGYFSPVEREWRLIMKRIRVISKSGGTTAYFKATPFSFNVQRLLDLGYKADTYRVDW